MEETVTFKPLYACVQCFAPQMVCLHAHRQHPTSQRKSLEGVVGSAHGSGGSGHGQWRHGTVHPGGRSIWLGRLAPLLAGSREVCLPGRVLVIPCPGIGFHSHRALGLHTGPWAGERVSHTWDLGVCSTPTVGQQIQHHRGGLKDITHPSGVLNSKGKL